MKNRKIGFYISLLLFYILCVYLITGFGAIFLGITDKVLVLVLGILNSVIASVFFDIKPVHNLAFGFLISSIGLVLSYLLWMPISNFNFSGNLIIAPIIINVLFQTFSWKILENLLSKKRRIDPLVLSIMTVVLLVLAFNFWDYWKFEKLYNWNKKKKITIKIVDSKNGTPVAGDSIRMTVRRQPLYGIMVDSEVRKSVIDKNGTSEFELYLGSEHNIMVWRNNGIRNYFELTSKEIDENDTIEIKTTPKKDYKLPL